MQVVVALPAAGAAPRSLALPAVVPIVVGIAVDSTDLAIFAALHHTPPAAGVVRSSKTHLSVLDQEHSQEEEISVEELALLSSQPLLLADEVRLADLHPRRKDLEALEVA